MVDLSNMGITRLKNNFLNSSTVTQLDLSKNNIWEIKNGAFDSLPNLNFVNLTGNVFPFGNLNFTDFSAVETLVLDSSISNYEDKSVHTFHNDFIRDCDVISKRKYHNYGKKIVLLGSMKFFKVKKLYLRKNNIEKIILQDIVALSDIMPSITHLYLNENSLQSVDFLTSNFPSTLTHLHLENNGISSIKTNRSVNSLKVLTVDQNQIQSLCGAYQDCYGISMDMFEQLEYFSITNANLKNISPSSFKYSLALNYLNMSSNAIEIIEDNTFHNLINLETLDLNFNKLQTISYISGLKNLEYFSIAKNRISTLHKSDFDGLTNLKILNLSHNRLTEIISGTFDELVSLEKLDLSANKFKILLPDWISPKVSLKHLFLNDNSFKSWSSFSLMGIQSLQYVNVTGNPLNSTVTRLNLSKNNILKIENGAFDSLPNLNFVNLTRNLFPFGNLNLTNFTAVETLVLDSSICYCQDESVYTFYNDVREDCDIISTRKYESDEKTIVLLDSMKFSKVKKLYLRKNRIAEIILQDIEALSDIMPSITYLYLNENSLQSVDFLKKFPPTLTHLHLDNNQIGFIKPDRSSVNRLKVLTVDHNQMLSLCGANQDCPGILMDVFKQLEYFSITSVSLEYISTNAFEDFIQLNYLNMSHNLIPTFYNNTLSYLVKLKTLDLSFNNLRAIPYISGLKNLEYFSIAKNRISTLHKSDFDGLSNLKIFNLSHNRLTEINSGTFDELVSLEKLDLSANELEILSPDWIPPKVSLKHLFLNDNSFKSWSSFSLMGIQSLQYVNVTGNPLKLINIRALMTLPENTTVDIGNLNTMNYS
ncbi:Similar to Tollo: Toll-like receptor Tollo (Drosophila melanogaster) [Cotesia congregata]|uniref:Similar to Tollo: Toll-like receptor Tollo (Drosophila melanogaster) n=1 Tax=Cotesia congregata TaxID=51543 RepID=A0A8J2HP04_COTCN|nr:Similar to Tollo: Toll-like receptor Tollo (Drosophila melanogaster) [Cotesia congregata]